MAVSLTEHFKNLDQEFKERIMGTEPTRQPPAPRANDTQVGGTHYQQTGKPQHWDLVIMYEWDYFQAQITKYLMRWKTKWSSRDKKLEDLKKAHHFLAKYIESEEAKGPTVAEIMKADMAYGAKLDPNDHLVKMQFPTDEFTLEGYRADGAALYQCVACRWEKWLLTNREAYSEHATCPRKGLGRAPA